MKRIIFPLLMMFIVSGCAAGQEKINNLVENPENIIRDPEFVDYKTQLELAEKKYLNKEITYAEYLDIKKAVDIEYNKEVQQRNTLIDSQDAY